MAKAQWCFATLPLLHLLGIEQLRGRWAVPEGHLNMHWYLRNLRRNLIWQTGHLGLYFIAEIQVKSPIVYPGFIHIQCLEYLFMCICGVDDVFVASLLLPSVQILKENSRIPNCCFSKTRHRPMRAEVCSCEDIGSTIDLTSWWSSQICLFQVGYLFARS